MLDGRPHKGKPDPLKFYLRPQRSVRDRHSLKSVTLTLAPPNRTNVRQTVLGILSKAELPTSYVDSIDPGRNESAEPQSQQVFYDFGFGDDGKVDFGLQVHDGRTF